MACSQSLFKKKGNFLSPNRRRLMLTAYCLQPIAASLQPRLITLIASLPLAGVKCSLILNFNYLSSHLSTSMSDWQEICLLLFFYCCRNIALQFCTQTDNYPRILRRIIILNACIFCMYMYLHVLYLHSSVLELSERDLRRSFSMQTSNVCEN